MRHQAQFLVEKIQGNLRLSPKNLKHGFLQGFFRGGAWSCAANMRFWEKSGPAVGKGFLFLKKRFF